MIHFLSISDSNNSFSQGDLEHLFTSVLIKGPPREDRMQCAYKVNCKSQIFSEKSDLISFVNEKKLEGMKIIITNVSPCMFDQLKNTQVVTSHPGQSPKDHTGDVKRRFVQLTSYRWNAFLLWNSGLEDCDNTFLTEPFENCEKQIQEAFKQFGVEYSPSQAYIKALFELPVYRGLEKTFRDRHDVKEPVDYVYAFDT